MGGRGGVTDADKGEQNTNIYHTENSTKQTMRGRNSNHTCFCFCLAFKTNRSNINVRKDKS